MPDITWTFRQPQFGGTPRYAHQDDYSYASNGVLALKKLDSTGTQFDRVGRFFESEVVASTKACPAVTELFGFYAWMAEPVSDETVKFQLSTDGGTTWQWWDGAAWVTTVAGSTEANEWSDIDENLQTFAQGARDFAVRIFLIPSTDFNVSPCLFLVTLFVEWEYNYLEDLQRSMKRFVDNVQPRRTALVELCGENNFSFPGLPPMALPIEVYDLTNDPTRETNLFDRLETCQVDPDADPTCQIVWLTAYVDGEVEVRYGFTPTIIIATADAEYTEAPIPSIVIQFQNDEDMPLEFEGTRVYDVSVSRWLARERHAPLIIESRVRITSQTDNKMDILALDDAIREAFRRCRRHIPSVNVHKEYSVVKFQGTSRSDLVSQELRTRSALLTVVGKRWSPAYIERSLTREVIMTVGTILTADSEVTLDAT